MSIDEAEYLDRLRTLWAKNWPTSVPCGLRYPFGEIPLSEYLRERARKTPRKPAVIFYGTVLSYGKFDWLSDRFAALLASEGVTKGDRVAVFLPTCLQFHIAFYGILKLGAIHVPVNPMFKEHELQDTGAEVIVAQDQLMPLVRQVLPQTRLRRVFVTSMAETLPAQPSVPVPERVAAPRIICADAVDLLPALQACTAPAPRDVPTLDDVAALNYTGGTTGLPKGCIHTQRNMIYTAATACGRYVSAEAAEQEVVLSFYPLFWIAGENTGLIMPVFNGSTLIELSRWDPVGWMASVELYEVTGAGMLVDNAISIMDHPDVGKYDLRSLQRTGVSSFVKKLNTDYRRGWETLTGVTMAEAAWGMTETHTHDTFTTGMQGDDWDLKQQPIFVGLPAPGTEFKICDFSTGEILPLGEEGEIVVRSPSQLKGYWNKPEATAASMRHGWFHTGDMGILDKEGFLHFLGRRKEMLKVTGMSVFPAEIEAMLGRHPAVIGSGVVGRPDEARGQVPVAFVLLAQDAVGKLTQQELTAWCQANMATYKVPEIRFVDSLPMTATGKVKKEELAKLHLA
jgi:long-chain acyl-CoA synthetase